MSIEEIIRSRPCPDCHVCGARGEPLYQGLRDRLFGAPGDWDLKRCPNSECGLLWLDPMPVEEDIGKAYANYLTHADPHSRPLSLTRRIFDRTRLQYYSKKYDYPLLASSPLYQFLMYLSVLLPGYRAQWDSMVFHLSARPGGRLLEVGCGNGAMLKAMETFGWDAQGVDFDPIAVRVARQAGLRVHLGNLKDQAFGKEQFDAVVMSHVIEHVPDPSELFQECFRILKPGGYLVCMTPNVRSWAHKLYGSACLHLDPPRHLHLFTAKSLRQLANNACFFQVKIFSSVSGSNSVFPGSWSIQRTGRYDLICSPSVLLKFSGRALQFLEWLICRFRNDAGEELVMIGQK